MEERNAPQLLKQNEVRSIKQGDRIFSELPFVSVLKSKYRRERCDNCLKETKVLKCSKCNYVYYCGRECQMKAWLIHKTECDFLKRTYPREVPDAARMICRIIIKLSRGGDLEKGFYTESCSRRFRDLMSHNEEIMDDAKRIEHLDSLHSVLYNMMEGSDLIPNKIQLLGIYGRLIINSFNILNGEMNSIATAIYLGASVINHSCKPNAVATFEGTTLHLHATQDIEFSDWSEIFISYIDLLSTTEQRREDLRANYYFTCICSKCVDPQEILEMNAAACPNKKCNAFVNISLDHCQNCDTKIATRHRDGFMEAIKLTTSSLENMKEIAYLDVCKICLGKQIGYLHPLNVWRVKTLDAAFEAAIEIGKWMEAITFGEDLVPGFRKYYGDWNPLLGILYMKLGKIQLFVNYFKKAANNLKNALQILEITHGRDHSLIREQLIPMLLQATAEISE